MQYSNFKDTLQNIASQIGNVEQEVEEHKYVAFAVFFGLFSLSWSATFCSVICDASPVDILGNDLSCFKMEERRRQSCSVRPRV